MELNLSNKKVGLIDLLPFKSYIIMLIANTISRFGDSIDSVAYEWMVYVLTGSKLLMGTLLAVNALPNLLFSIFSGVFADRFPKKMIMILGNLGRGIMVSLTALLFFNGLLKPYHLFIFTFINSTFETFAAPAQGSILPLLIPKDLYLQANSLSSSASTFSQLIGLGCAGLIIGLFGIPGAIFIDGLTFFIACALFSIMKPRKAGQSSSALTFSTYKANLREGFAFVKKNTIILITIIFAAFVNFCLSPFNVLQSPYVKDILKSGPEGLSMIGMAFMLGMIIGGLLVGQFGSNFNKSILIVSGILILGVCYALLSLPGSVNLGISPVLFASIICFILGIGLPIANTPLNTYLLEYTPGEMLGRVSALLGMFAMCATPLGSALTGVAAQYVSIPVLFLCMGALIALAALSLLFNKSFMKA